MAYRKKTQEVKEETVVTPDVVSSEEVETQVINTNEKAKKVIKENVAGETVIVAYNGVHSQVFDVPCKGQIKRVVIKGNNADLIGKGNPAYIAAALTAVFQILFSDHIVKGKLCTGSEDTFTGKKVDARIITFDFPVVCQLLQLLAHVDIRYPIYFEF